MRRFLVISVLFLSFCSLSGVADARERGFRSLFNGKDLSGWIGDLDGYTVADRAIYAKDGFNNIYTQGGRGYDSQSASDASQPCVRPCRRMVCGRNHSDNTSGIIYNGNKGFL